MKSTGHKNAASFFETSSLTLSWWRPLNHQFLNRFFFKFWCSFYFAFKPIFLLITRLYASIKCSHLFIAVILLSQKLVQFKLIINLIDISLISNICLHLLYYNVISFLYFTLNLHTLSFMSAFEKIYCCYIFDI